MKEKIIKNLKLTVAEVKENIELTVRSVYGGTILGFVKVSEIDSLIQQEERQINVDFFLSRG